MKVTPWIFLLATSLPLAMANSRAQADDVGQIIFASNRTGNSEIFAMNPDGSAQTNLTNTSGVDEYFPDWSTDGNIIVYSRTNGLWTMNPDGTNPTVLVNGNNPIYGAYRPNSSIVSYSRPNGDYDIFTTTLDGATTTNIIHNTYGDYYGRWSPDGRKIVFYTFDVIGGGYFPNLFLANPDGTGQTRLTSGSGTNQNARWSPFGDQLVFQSSRDGHPQIYRINSDGTNPVRLTTNAFNDTCPAYSPDGSKIAFVSNRDGNNEIYVMNADGTNQTRLTNNSGDDNYLAWQVARPANAPTASVNSTSIAEGNTGSRNVLFTVSLSAASTVPVTVNYRFYDITAKNGVDYNAPAPTPLTFAPGETSKTIAVPIVTNTVPQANRAFAIRISTIDAGINIQQGTATIIDDDAVPTISIGDVTVNEGNSGPTTAAFPITLSSISGRDVTVKYATADGTATGGSDYTSRVGGVTIPAGQTTAVINMAVVGDAILESDETFYVNLSAPVGATLGDSQGMCTILNDDTGPLLTMSSTSVTEGEDATFTLTLSKASTLPISVNYTTKDGTALSGSDYVAKSGTLTIPAGQTSGTVTVSTINDVAIEPDESFTLVLSKPVNVYISSANSTATCVIHSDDVPEIAISDVSLREGKSGQRSMFFSVTLSEPAPFPIAVDYATADNTALAGSDYVAAQGTLHFASNQLSQALVVPIIGDTTIEPNEVFFVNLSNAVNGKIVTPTGHGTIVDDDGKPQISIDDASIVEGNSGTTQLVFTVSLSAPSTSDVTVDYSTSDGTATEGSDYAAALGTVTIPAGQLTAQIMVTINGDSTLEPDETFTVNLSGAVGATLGDNQATGIITNDDVAAITARKSQQSKA